MSRLSRSEINSMTFSIGHIANSFPGSAEATAIRADVREWAVRFDKDNAPVKELYAIRDRLNELVTERLFRSEIQPPLVERSVSVTLYGSKANDRLLAAAIAMDEVVPGQTNNVTLVDNTTVQDAELSGVRYTFRKVSNA